MDSKLIRKADSDNTLFKIAQDNNNEADEEETIQKAVSMEDMRKAYKQGKKDKKIHLNLQSKQQIQNKKLFDDKMTLLKNKYFFAKGKSISNEIIKQCCEGKNYVKIGISWRDFCGWNEFLPYEQARPENCVKLFIDEVQTCDEPLLDPDIRWEFIRSSEDQSKKIKFTWTLPDSVPNSPDGSRDPSPARSRSKSLSSTSTTSPDITPSTSNMSLEDYSEEDEIDRKRPSNLFRSSRSYRK